MLTGADVQSLKDYVKGSDGGMQNQAASTVRLHVTHSNLKATFVEVRLDRHMSVAAVKSKISTHCGTSPEDMSLSLRDESGQAFAQLSDDHRLLGYYSPYDGCQLHVLDRNPHSLSAHGWLEDVSKVKKYTMSDADYEKREGTYRAYQQQMRKTDPEWTAEKELCMRRGEAYVPPAKKIEDDDYQAEAAGCISIGQRCEVNPGGKRGEIRYVGRCSPLPKGFWIGVKFDEPVGKNNGCVKGQKFFDCADGYGSFLRPEAVKTGDYPPEDAFAFSDEDEI